MLLRVRTQIGTWRLKDVKPSDTFETIRERTEKEFKTDLQGRQFSADPSGNVILMDSLTVADGKLKNGDMIYNMVDETKTGIHEASSISKKIMKDGTIVTQDISSMMDAQGFRPGMMPLRNMKMQWTLNEFVALDSQFEFKIKAQEKSVCKLFSINSAPIQSFQNYMRNFDFHIIRVGYMYGTIEEDQSVKAEFIYEPPQEGTDTTFTIMEDSKGELVDAIAGMLGMRKVGWIFAHPPREKGFHFSSAEVLFTAEQQLEAAGGIEDTPFTAITVSVDAEGQSVVEAFQVSKQCMEMVAEGVLEPSANLGSCAVNNTFTAVVEGKNVKEVDNNFFLVTTPIEQYESKLLVNFFPVANRIDTQQSRDDIKRQFSRAGKEGWGFAELLADFQLLLYLTNFLDPQCDLPNLVRAATNKEIPLDEGYLLLLRSIAGMD